MGNLCCQDGDAAIVATLPVGRRGRGINFRMDNHANSPAGVNRIHNTPLYCVEEVDNNGAGDTTPRSNKSTFSLGSTGSSRLMKRRAKE